MKRCRDPPPPGSPPSPAGTPPPSGSLRARRSSPKPAAVTLSGPACPPHHQAPLLASLCPQRLSPRLSFLVYPHDQGNRTVDVCVPSLYHERNGHRFITAVISIFHKSPLFLWMTDWSRLPWTGLRHDTCLMPKPRPFPPFQPKICSSALQNVARSPVPSAPSWPHSENLTFPCLSGAMMGVGLLNVYSKTAGAVGS